MVKRSAKKYDHGASKHVYDIVTGDESWIYAYEPKSKQQSTVWVFSDEQNPTMLFAREALPSKWSPASSEKPNMWQLYHYCNVKRLILNGIKQFVYQKSSEK